MKTLLKYKLCVNHDVYSGIKTRKVSNEDMHFLANELGPISNELYHKK